MPYEVVVAIGAVLTLWAATIWRANAGVERQKKDGIDWVKFGAIFSGIYTILTAVIIFVSLRQTAQTVDSNRISRESFTAVQRAFVVVSDMASDVYPGELPPTYDIFPIIRNSGNTPTKDLRVFYVDENSNWLEREGGSSLAPFIEQPEQNFPRDPSELLDTIYQLTQSNDVDVSSSANELLYQTVYKWVLGPGAQFPKQVFKNHNHPVQFGGYHTPGADGRGRFVYGVIRYRDVFENSPLHETKFCFGIGRFIGKPSDPTDIHPIFTPCAHWNCSDDECKGDREESEKDLLKAAENKKRLDEMFPEFHRPQEPSSTATPPPCLGPRVACP
jgi:hypothetical protein